jgi:trans-aconitate 2-methyltransferase
VRVSTNDPRPRYTFGDTPRAAERLQLLARVFDAPSRSFLAESVARPPRIALDVGCGPGVTTRLVAAVTGAGRTVGLDASPAFIDIAGTEASSGVGFLVHDVTRLPLPLAPVDLIYCRLLLAHLPDVEGTVDGFMTQLAAGGLLLVDEVEWIDARHPVLATYERMVLDLVGSQGAPMYAGPIVDTLRRGDGWVQRSSRVRVVPVATAAAARMYGMNLATWRDDPHIRDRYDPDAVNQLADDLAALAESVGTDEITWGVRQVVFERT